ncbi:MAG: hypothetical protein OSA43_09730, partial [Pirellulales bacterium]|nr:hypothetical protein [Pirellulales bacterium]
PVYAIRSFMACCSWTARRRMTEHYYAISGLTQMGAGMLYLRWVARGYGRGGKAQDVRKPAQLRQRGIFSPKRVRHHHRCY